MAAPAAEVNVGAGDPGPREPRAGANANPAPPPARNPAAAQSSAVSSLMGRFRSLLMTMGSLALTTLVVCNAWYQRQQFYPSVVYITKSNPSMAVIYVQAFVFVILFGKLMRKIFFGRLRAAEFEHLLERSWYAVTETCLAFTVFKDDFSPKFVALFTLLLFLKSFHWLAEDRVDFMERSPSITALFHVRVIFLALILAFVDVQFIMHAYGSTVSKGPSVQLVFGFEYAVLLTIVANTVAKYVLHGIDLYSENPWENKAVFMLYTELAIGFVKVVLYVVFIGIMIRIYTLPLFAVRPMYLTMRAFKKAFNDVILSRRAINNMNMYYPDATEEELRNTDNVCIICREEMQAPSTKKLPCGHIFHKNCLRSWFQRQQTCPTCRLDVLRSATGVPTPGGAGGNAGAQQGGGRGARGAAAGPQVPPFMGGEAQNFFAQWAAAVAAANNDNNNMNNNMNNVNNGGQRPPSASAAPQPTPGRSQSGATGGGATAATSTGPNTAAPAVGNPFFFPRPPPFPQAVAGAPSTFPPMPPMPPFFGPMLPPPPMPPPNFTGLTETELRAMEGQERDNVEARIRCLRNIQVLLDAAVMEMQQYSNVVTRLNRGPPPPSAATAAAAGEGATAPPAPTSSSTSTTATVAAAAAASSSSSPSATSTSPSNGATARTAAKETGTKPKTSAVAAGGAAAAAVSSEAEPDMTKIIEKMDAPAEDKDRGSSDNEEKDELRRRRLARFEQQAKDQ